MENICLLSNVLQRDERKQLIENSQSLFVVTNNAQTPSILHLHYKFIPILNHLLSAISHRTELKLEMISAWMLRTRGKEEDVSWHNHLKSGADYSMVYYVKSPLFFTGTSFRHGFVRASQNSMILFPSCLEHASPRHPLGIERYVLSADLKVK
tara:strand:- start:848 stop:1306 length:459 start_codon:yes stop_codon:yes gene_type:complete